MSSKLAVNPTELILKSNELVLNLTVRLIDLVAAKSVPTTSARDSRVLKPAVDDSMLLLNVLIS